MNESDKERWVKLGINELPPSFEQSIEDVRQALKGVTPEDVQSAHEYLARHSGQFLEGHQLPHVEEEPPPRPEAERPTFGKL